MSTLAVARARAGPREWSALAVLALPTLLLSLDLSVLYLALPEISSQLGPSSTELLWMTDIYGFLIAGFLVTMGTLGDRIGRRRLLLTGAAAFACASGLAAFADSPATLIGARAAMGVAGAAIMPSTLALTSTMFTDPRQRATAIAIVMSCFTAGTAVGPLVGGAMLDAWWWGSVFLLGVPVMLLLLVTGPALLPEHRDPAPGTMDLPSVALSLTAILTVVYALKEAVHHGPSPLTALAATTGLALGAVFVSRQRRLEDPLVDLSLFARPAFRAAIGAVLVGTLVMGGITLFATQYLQLVEGLEPLIAGMWLVPPALGVTAGSMLAPAAARRIGATSTMSLGLVVTALGFVALTRVTPDSGVELLIAGYTIAFFGVGPVGVLGTDMVVGSAPTERAGSAAALSETAAEMGIALGVASLGSLGTAIFAARTDGAQITDLTGAALPAAAQDAFAAGLNVVAAVSAVAALGFALLTARALRATGAHPHTQPDDAAAPPTTTTGSDGMGVQAPP